VLERPLDRELAELAFVPVAVGAAAVLQIPADGVVVVAVDRGYAAFLDQRADLVGVWSVADQTTPGSRRRRDPGLDPVEYRPEGRQVGVDVGDDRGPCTVKPKCKY
jgi:hypothetical protein